MRSNPGRAGTLGLLIVSVLLASAGHADPLTDAPSLWERFKRAWIDAPPSAAQGNREEPTEHILEESREEREERSLGVPQLIRPEVWTVEWRNGFHVIRADQRYELLIGAQLMGEAAAFHLDEDLLPSESGWGGGADLRRARVFGQGVIAGRWYFKAAVDLADLELKDAYVGVLGVGPIRALQVGYMKTPFSLEEMTSLRHVTFLERSLSSALAPGREAGILASGVAFDENLRWALGAFFVSEGLREEEDAVEGYKSTSVTLRVTGTPIWQEDGGRMLLLGASYSHSFGSGRDVAYKEHPETRLVSPLLDTQTIADVGTIDRLGIEAAWADGAKSVQAELLLNHLSRKSGSGIDFWGGYVQAAWLLTGEHRSYGRASGVFQRVVPDQPFDWRRRQWGAVEAAVRLSHLDLNAGGVRGGIETDTTLGLNWFPRSNVRVTANYILAHVNGQGWASVFQARLGYEF